MKKINEIFYSIQGEGYFTGTPAVFVRFSGCNLRCPFCDTEHKEGKMLSDDEIIAEIISSSLNILPSLCSVSQRRQDVK